MKAILPVLLIGIGFLAGCDSSKKETDSRFQQMTGTWQEGDKGVFTFSSDASFNAEVKTGSWGILVPQSFRISGTWKLSRDFLVIHISHSTHDNERFSGMKISEKLLDVDRNSFRTIGDNGKQNVYTRIN